MIADYSKFLAKKTERVVDTGIQVSDEDIHPLLFQFQRDVTRWALRKGRSAIFLDTGLGKTFVQLEWARLLGQRTLIIAPLSVARQTVREARKIGLVVYYSRSGDDVIDGINITNYEMIDSFLPSEFGAVVLDESSILKALAGKIRGRLIAIFNQTPYRLCCTATPAPNDYIELGNHAHFLGISTTAEMLGTFFINANRQQAIMVGDKIYERKGSNKGGQEWRLKKHAEQSFFEWLSTWAITMSKPSDLGYDDDGFILPTLSLHPHFIPIAQDCTNDALFHIGLKGLGQRAKIRRESASVRLIECVRIVTTNLAQKERSCLSPTANTDTTTILPIERNYGSRQKSGLQNEHQSKSSEIANTNTTIICGIAINIDEPQNNMISEMSDGESGILLIPSIAKENLTNISSETEHNAVRNGYPDMGSPAPTMTPSLKSRAGSVQSVGQQAQVNEIVGEPSTLTMTTRQALCEDYSAQTVISASGNSETTPNCSKEQPIISNALPKWVIWCGLDSEQELVARKFGPLCVSISGNLPIEEKIRREELWREGPVPIMVTKARIFGFGVNWQCAHRMIFFGLSDSWETFYQAIRREWRYGQQSPVDVHIVISELEQSIYQNIMRKEALAKRLREGLIRAMKGYEMSELGNGGRLVRDYSMDETTGKAWILRLGDSCERLKELAADSVDLSIYSPPFIDLFTYSASDRDLGNSRTAKQFYQHYAFIIREMLRVTKPGRLSCVHVSDIPAMASRDGYIGVKDFPGKVIRAHEREGWVFIGRAFVQKNPQAQAIRVKSKALLFVQLRKDSADSRPALIDQILLFKKPGENAIPITPVANGELDNETWIEWAHGIWLGISESDTLQYHDARDDEDEKHICPLQLGTIKRCLKLYSNPGELVLDPFAGIGSTGFEAIRLNRRFIGIELKPEYFKMAAKNLAEVETIRNSPTLFDYAGVNM